MTFLLSFIFIKFNWIEIMDQQTLESLAEFICGDSSDFPTYRTGSELTRFFQRAGFSNFTHDGSTRKWWTLSVLGQLSENNLKAVILRLADPKEYKGNKEDTKKAIDNLNSILLMEGLRVELSGINPKILIVDPQFQEDSAELTPLPPPDFLSLKMDVGLGEILKNRWSEIQTCFDAKAFLAATILMGSFLEGMLFSVMVSFPKEANSTSMSPKYKDDKVKRFEDWTLSDMINVAHECGWLDFDVHKFSHSLRDYRNLIHPYEQMISKAFPDEDTSKISWLVVQAAANDLARKLK